MKKSRDMGRPREPDSDLLAKPKKCWCKSTPGTCIGSRNRNYCIVRMRKSELREVPIFRAGNRPPISSREPTRSQLGRLICSLAPHISLIKNCLSCSTAIAATASGVICNITSRRSVPALCYQHAPVAFMAKTPVRGGLAN